MSKFPGRIVSNLTPAGYSVFFDGTGDGITISAAGVGPTGTETFCFEVWMNASSFGGNFPRIFEGTATDAFQVYLSGGSLIVRPNAGTALITYALTGLTDQWLHICITRNSANSQIRLFVNGILRGYNASGGTNFAASSTWRSLNEGAGIIGYLSNMRVVRGSIPIEYQTSVTTTGTTVFTPPTQLLNITNTSLLTCNSPALVDQSTNNFTITANGNAAVSTFTPFTAYVPYNPALGASTPGVWTLDEALQAKGTRQWNMYDPSFNLTTLLLHGNGTNGAQNNQFLDSSSNNFTITRNPASGPNAPTQGSFSPFSQTPGYWGINFNRGYVSSTLTGQAAGTGSFTYEMFFNITMREPAVSNVAALFSTRSSGTGADGIDCQITSTGQVQVGTSAAILFTSSAGIVRDGVWYHLAIVRNGTTNCTVYLNGVSIGTFSANTNYSSTALYLGVFGGINDFFRGFISNFRYTRDAVYTSTFTVATAPLQPITNTQFLTAQSNRFLDTSANGFTVTPVVLNGSTSISPFGPFYSPAAYTPATVSGSGYFDGTVDSLTISQPVTNFYSGLGDWEMEAWVYPLSFNGPQYSCPIFCFGNGATEDLMLRANPTTGNITGVNLYAINSSNAVMLQNPGTSSAAVLNLNQWSHVAVNRVSGVFTVWVNGTRVIWIANSGATTNIANVQTTAIRTTGTVFDIGKSYSGSPTGIWNGYISNVKIKTGSTSYSGSTITVPTSPVTPSGASFCGLFTNAGIVDSTAKNVVETVADAKISTAVSKFGGSSIFFDGTGDYLQTAQNQLFNLGASDFTIEFWIYPTSFSVTSYPLYSASARSKADCVAFEINTGGVLNVYVTGLGGAAWSIISAGNIGTLTLNTWSHVAFVRNGSLFRGYLNGVQSGLTTSSTSNIASFDGWNIGYNGVSGNMTGYLDDIRITRAARYTANFTPQTSQWQDE